MNCAAFQWGRELVKLTPLLFLDQSYRQQAVNNHSFTFSKHQLHWQVNGEISHWLTAVFRLHHHVSARFLPLGRCFHGRKPTLYLHQRTTSDWLVPGQLTQAVPRSAGQCSVIWGCVFFPSSPHGSRWRLKLSMVPLQSMLRVEYSRISSIVLGLAWQYIIYEYTF